jgi:microcystin-dependent protein
MDGDGTNFMAEIGIAAFNYPPKGWAFCNGQLLPINQNQALFSLLGTNYGGDGRVNFGLPDLRGRVPIHMGNGHTLGERAGQEAHTIILSELPTHTHFAQASSATATAVVPTNSHVVAQGAFESYRAPSSLATMDPATIANVGGSQPHLNMQPFLVLNFCIALQGIFPSAT